MDRLLGAAIVIGSIFGCSAASACDVTLIPGGPPGAVQSALAHPKFTIVCLSPGNYSLGTATLQVFSGKSLIGTGAQRGDVILESSAARMVENGSNVTLRNFTLQPTAGHSPEFGVLSYGESNLLVWGLDLKGANVNLGLKNSNYVSVWDTLMSENGSNPWADPNVWIDNSIGIEFLWGELRGDGTRGNGDGELAAYNSTNVRIYGTYVVNSGASAIYLVNCDYCTVENATLVNAGEWGLDIVGGSDHFTAINNFVWSSYFGGSVFDQTAQVGGTYTGNTFLGNNQSGIASCNGINVGGNLSALTLDGNTATPGPVICPF